MNEQIELKLIIFSLRFFLYNQLSSGFCSNLNIYGEFRCFHSRLPLLRPDLVEAGDRCVFGNSDNKFV